MQDEYVLELTEEQYDFVIELKKQAYKKLSLMSKDERLEFFRSLCYEKDVNIEKEINGTVYKVNSYFNSNSDESIAKKIARLLLK